MGKVPMREPTTWCSRMLLVPKQDRSPHKTVDLLAVSKVAAMQNYATESQTDRPTQWILQRSRNMESIFKWLADSDGKLQHPPVSV